MKLPPPYKAPKTFQAEEEDEDEEEDDAFTERK